MEVGADGVDGELERGGYTLVAAFFLVVEDEDGALHFGELLEGGVDGLLQVRVHHALLGGAGVLAGVGVAGEVFYPGCGIGLVVEGWFWGDVFAFLAAALPLVLGEVEDDPVEVSGQGRVAAEVREGAVEAEEGFLGEVFDLRAGAGEAGERAEDHGLMLSHEGFEGFRGCEVGAQSLPSDCIVRQKFHGG